MYFLAKAKGLDKKKLMFRHCVRKCNACLSEYYGPLQSPMYLEEPMW